MREHHAFGAAGGAGGVNERGQIRGFNLDLRYGNVFRGIEPISQGADIDALVIDLIVFGHFVIGDDDRL